MHETKIVFYNKNKKLATINCEIARTVFEKMKGLMNRTYLPSDSGMLFQFLLPGIRFFWMKNVKIPLDIIFVNRHLEIISIYEAPVKKGFFYKNYWSKGFCKYVIETNIGFCKKNNIKSGDKIKINI